jgi:hypothetical protein
MANTEYTYTLYRQDTNAKVPQILAWVAPQFLPDEMYYKAQVQTTKESQKFLDIQQAKDWAQAVVLLTQ